MNYDEFLSCIKDGVAVKLGEEMSGELEILLHKTVKNNDLELEGLSISTCGGSVSRIIYLNDYYGDYLKGRRIEDIVDDICGIYMEYSDRFEFDPESFKKYSNVRERILYKLINRDMNKEYLKTMPHIPFLDLAIVFYCCVGNCNQGEALIMINNEYTGMWEVDANMLLKEAAANTSKILPAEIANLGTIVSGEYDDINQCYISDFDAKSLELLAGGNKSEESMYILTNSHRNYGAAAVLYDGIMSKLSDAFDADIYVLPSSVHEVILVPDTGRIKREELSRMVRGINKSSVAYDEILSNRVYRYSRTDKKIQ